MEMGDLELTVEKEISSTPANIYNALTDPQILSRWFTTNAKGDLSIGGRYSNDDADEGEYLELRPFEKIRYTWENPGHYPGTEVSIEIISLTYDITRVRVTHFKLESEEAIEEMRGGWTWALDNLKQFLETGIPITYDKWKRQQQG